MKNLNKILQIIQKHKSFILSTHVNPDPDALCSELALAAYLRSINKKVRIINDEELTQRFQFLPGAKMIKCVSSIKIENYDVLIVVDCGDLERIGKVKDIIDNQKIIINIDHHITNDYFGDINLVEPKASSTAEILFELLVKGGCKFTKSIAQNLYAGIMTDTGCFRYNNTTSKTHKIVSELCVYPFSPSDLYKRFYESVPLSDLKEFTKVVSRFEDYFQKKYVVVELSKKTESKFSDNFDLRDAIFKYLRSIEEAEVFVILTENKKSLTRVNFRSSGRVNVGRLAQVFNGGGHHNASGGVIYKNISDAKRMVESEVRKII